MGASRSDGGRRSGSRRGRARHSVLKRDSGAGWVLDSAALHRRRIPARVLFALPRLSEILPALGARPISQSEIRQFAPRRLRSMTIVAVSGLMREARIAGGPGVRSVVGGGDSTALRRKL